MSPPALCHTATKSHYLFYSVQAVKFPLIITFEATAVFGKINTGMLFCDHQLLQIIRRFFNQVKIINKSPSDEKKI